MGKKFLSNVNLTINTTCCFYLFQTTIKVAMLQLIANNTK